jgi:cell division protein ZapA (FtsZ GTPase activity inhibitor)
VSVKKHTLKVSILNEEYSIRSDTPPEHARAVAQYLDKAIRTVMSSGGVVETNRAVVLAALQITGELFEAKAALDACDESITGLCDYVRPLLPPSKRQPSARSAQ